MNYNRGLGDVMTVDPNKQAFPLIGGATHHPLPDTTLSSPSKEMESIASSSKTSLELPRLINSQEELAPAAGRDQDYALKPSLPTVRRSRYARSGPRPDSDRDELAERFQTKNPLPYQASNFRSSTIIRTVPHQNKKGVSHPATALLTSLSKKRVVAVHTEPFLWSKLQEADGPFPEGQSLPEKFLAEKERLVQVRGQKRRMIHPIHRQMYHDLHIGGQAPNLHSKLDYKGEADKIRHAVLPTEAQELYLGRGITFPESHSTAVYRKHWHERILEEVALPSSVFSAHNVATAAHDVESPRRKSVTAPSGTKLRTEEPSEAGSRPVPPTVQRSPTKPKISKTLARQDDSGVSNYEGSAAHGQRTERKSSEDRGRRSQTRKMTTDEKSRDRVKKGGSERQKIPVVKDFQQEDKTRQGLGERVADDRNDFENNMETEDGGDVCRPEETLVVVDTADDDATNDISLPRPDSEMDIDEPLEDTSALRAVTRQSVSPIKPPSPNPLMSADLHLNITDEKRDELALRFTKLDTDKDGHITFKELETTFPNSLSKAQQRYIKEAYDLVSSTTFFGLEEFVTISCLCERLARLTGPIRDAYEIVNVSTLQQDITQFVVLFSTLDRQQTGCITLGSLRELLATAFKRELASSTTLFNNIIAGIGKTGSLSVDKVEYLVSIPYFLSYK